ncbi:unnamed protein product [Colletotrichum noveboracense]|uniref:Fumarylacetoacetase-like C-terminal domain-containing protein n=1 Tax=Colletotrichum noveboracense TaxID=2664923 RepID=A0A9W4RIL3_9PEZI|nr:unnamed protein product [Colletotrichum noveboracense]
MPGKDRDRLNYLKQTPYLRRLGQEAATQVRISQIDFATMERISYQLLTYETTKGHRGAIHVNGMVYDLCDVVSTTCVSMLDALRNWDQISSRLETFALDPNTANISSQALKNVNILAPIPSPTTVFCAGGNFTDHLDEMSRVLDVKPGPNLKERGEPPFFFLKNTTGVCGPGSVTKIDSPDIMVDWELELVAIIGRVARHVSRDEAMRYVAGFTVGNDLSFRQNIQRKELQPGDAFKFDWFRQKCFDGSCPVGPWMMPTNQVPNIEDLGMRLWVDDELMQDTNTGNMIFSVAEQVAELSHQLTLHPGDMIMTGTGAGVGLGRGRFLKTGNTVRCMIEGIGEFSHYIG